MNLIPGGGALLLAAAPWHPFGLYLCHKSLFSRTWGSCTPIWGILHCCHYRSRAKKRPWNLQTEIHQLSPPVVSSRVSCSSVALLLGIFGLFFFFPPQDFSQVFHCIRFKLKWKSERKKFFTSTLTQLEIVMTLGHFHLKICKASCQSALAPLLLNHFFPIHQRGSSNQTAWPPPG